MTKKRRPATIKGKNPGRGKNQGRMKPAPFQAVRKAGPRSDQPLPDLVIVGVGASAGGLEAFSQVLRALPDAPGLAIVFVQHLSPQHDSALVPLLSAQTALPVIQVSEGMRVERDHIYVIPPNV